MSFLLSLTDERKRQEQAPFDHPQLFVPVGQLGDESAIVGSSGVLRDGFRENEEVLEIPAVGVGGRVEALLPPLGTFLNLSPFQP